MKKISLVILMLCLSVGLFANSNYEVSTVGDAEKVQQQRTEKLMSEANNQIGMPAVTNFQEKKLAKMVFELRDDANLICHAYLFNEEQGCLGQYLGKALGFGIPYSVQFTNPEKITKFDGGEYGAIAPITTPQADPNGLYMPSSSSATWLMLFHPETNKPTPVYVEPTIVVSPFKLPHLEPTGLTI